MKQRDAVRGTKRRVMSGKGTGKKRRSAANRLDSELKRKI